MLVATLAHLLLSFGQAAPLACESQAAFGHARIKSGVVGSVATGQTAGPVPLLECGPKRVGELPSEVGFTAEDICKCQGLWLRAR